MINAVERFWQRIHVGMDEMYETVHQATYMFFEIDEMYKLVMDEIYEIVWILSTTKKKILRLTLYNRNNANNLFWPIAGIFLLNVSNQRNSYNLIL